jgi:hypothetical protein
MENPRCNHETTEYTGRVMVNRREVANMEARIGKLETPTDKAVERLGMLERDVAVIKSNYATRSDISDAKNSIVMWGVSVILLAQLLPALLEKFGM